MEETSTSTPGRRNEGTGRSIGAILIDSGRLSTEAAEKILREQKEKGMRFGDAGLSLGVITPEDIQFALSRQFDYPYLTVGESRVDQRLVAAYKPFNQEVESLRALRSQLMLRWFGERKCLAIASPGRGEGRSFLAANLAIVFSQLGEHTLLIDADMRNPRQHQLFGLENRSGLSEILAGRGGQEAVQRIAEFKDLSVLTAGASPPNPQELLARPQFAQLLDDSSREYDVVLLDTSAAHLSADTHAVAVRSGGALLVARRNYSIVSQVAAVRSSLEESGVTIVGSVLNDF